ncbi:MAG: helix-turn-helix domain-containing protein [Ruminococcaceae bacterium]|nr:helix-turn-helix domain-containing protein [Oscillospiraceae bacterium]
MFKPILTKLPLTFMRMKYGFHRSNRFTTPNEQELDDSHIHSFYEIYVNVSGDVSFLVNNKLFGIKSGDIIITRPDDVHVCIINSPCIHDHFVLWFSCPTPSMLMEFIGSDDFRHIYSADEKDKDMLFSILQGLDSSDRDNNEAARTAYIFALIALINARHKQTAPRPADEVKIPAEMQRVLDYINENFAAIRYISDVVENTYVSTTTLSRWFRKYIHLSPHEYLEAKKLSYARKLLDEGKSVTDVCMESGFSDCSHFISVFKKNFGITPSKYARDSKSVN